MAADQCRQEIQLKRLASQAQRYLTAFRWLWLLNLAAALIGLATGYYRVTAVAAVTSLLALIGVALARRGRRTVSETAEECHRIRDAR